LGRHGGGRLHPCADTLIDYEMYINEHFLPELIDGINHHIDLDYDLSLENYLSSFDEKKRDKYKLGLQKAKDTLKVPRILEVLVKNGEIAAVSSPADID